MLNTYSSRAIGSIAKVKGGKRLPPNMGVQDEETVHPYLRVVDFGDDGVVRSNLKFISNETFEYVKRYTISSDDVYVSIAGTIGRVGIVPEDLSGANLTENAAKITDINAQVDKRYLLYFLRSARGQGELQNKAGGTSQPKLALFRIEEIEFPCPPIGSQRAIADLLSTYDDLIENNRRRMALLEESARLLYREWFVRLRFPGYEHTPIVDGVPQGWERKTLGDTITLNYGKALKAEIRVEGDYSVYGSSGIVGTHEKPLVQGPAIILGRKGNVGSVYWSSKNFYPIDTVYFVSPESSSLYLFYALKNMHFISTDVAVPGLNRDFAYSRPLLHPPVTLLRSFHETVEPIHAQLDKLEEMNQKLRTARDLLLPRLMSGELAV
jgi:type I restriction enzyme, S subunit